MREADEGRDPKEPSHRQSEASERDGPDRTKLGAPMFMPLGGWLMRSKPKPDKNGEIDPAWLRNYESEILYSRVKFVLGLAFFGFGLLAVPAAALVRRLTRGMPIPPSLAARSFVQ